MKQSLLVSYKLTKKKNGHFSKRCLSIFTLDSKNRFHIRHSPGIKNGFIMRITNEERLHVS